MLTAFLTLTIGYGIFKAIQTIYRLYFHPLASFPGPRAAAISRGWQKQFIDDDYPEAVYERLHREYNTKVLRIGPNELHLSDPETHKTIYNQTQPFLKDTEFYTSFQGADPVPNIFSASDPAFHRMRRRIMNAPFSKKAVTKLEPLLQEKLSMIGEKLDRIWNLGPIDINALYRTLATDMVTEFAFGGSTNTITESQDSFYAKFQDAFDGTAAIRTRVSYSLPFKLAFQYLPTSITTLLDKRVALNAHLEDMAVGSLKAHQKKMQEGAASGEEADAPVIMDLLDGHIGPNEQNIEAVSLVFAGSDTTAFTMTTGTYHILKNPKIEAKFVKAIEEAYEFRSELSVHDLESVPYLQAIVKESLRIAMPAPGRLPRIVPPSTDSKPALVVDGKVIPSGTSVGLSAYVMHFDESVWGPDAREFNPERWLESKERTNYLDSYFFTFGKGNRICIGLHLAQAEIMMGMTYLFRRYKMTLKSDGIKSRDYFPSAFVGQIMVGFEKR